MAGIGLTANVFAGRWPNDKDDDGIPDVIDSDGGNGSVPPNDDTLDPADLEVPAEMLQDNRDMIAVFWAGRHGPIDPRPAIRHCIAEIRRLTNRPTPRERSA